MLLPFPKPESHARLLQLMATLHLPLPHQAVPTKPHLWIVTLHLPLPYQAAPTESQPCIVAQHPSQCRVGVLTIIWQQDFMTYWPGNTRHMRRLSLPCRKCMGHLIPRILWHMSWMCLTVTLGQSFCSFLMLLAGISFTTTCFNMLLSHLGHLQPSSGWPVLLFGHVHPEFLGPLCHLTTQEFWYILSH